MVIPLYICESLVILQNIIFTAQCESADVLGGDYMAYTTTWGISEIWLAQSSGISA